MITRQKIAQSGKTPTIIVAKLFFGLPFGDKNMMKDKSISFFRDHFINSLNLFS